MNRLLLMMRTIRHLKLSQIFYYMLRRGLPLRRVSAPVVPVRRASSAICSPFPTSGIYVGDTTFRFLNAKSDIRVTDSMLDWSSTSRSLLWNYNLHYFHYLRECERSNENKSQLVDCWIKSNSQGTYPGWDPYPTSLRIVNWIFFIHQLPPNSVPNDWLKSLYLQTLWLEKNDERHILANHYFENLKALFFAGCFFHGPDADRWLERAAKEIPIQLDEQTLIDGGHYERSHLYHCRMLENYIDLLNFCGAFPDLCDRRFVTNLENTIQRGCDWLSDTLYPDGSIPLFNDSVNGESLQADALFKYAELASSSFERPTLGQPRLIAHEASGFYGYTNLEDMLLIDCGDIGPTYQPGHTHCDFLSYELLISKKKVVVDSGVFEYEPGSMRSYVRSTRAHNSVSVDGCEQSEVWGAFRVARRAKKIDAAIHQDREKINFRGSYRGFFGAGQDIVHCRSVELSLCPGGDMNTRMLVTDEIKGSDQHTVESFIHFHPDVNVRANHDGNMILQRGSSLLGRIRFSPEFSCRVESGFYCPEFGLKIPNQVLVLKVNGRLPLSLSYSMEFDSSIFRVSANTGHH